MAAALAAERATLLRPAIANALLGAVALGVAVATLTPVPVPPWVIGPKIGVDLALADLIRNVLFFAPLGVALALAGIRPSRVVALLVGVPVAIEMAQLVIPGRTSSAWDVMGNALGGLIAWIAVVARRFWLVPPRGLACAWCLLWAAAGVSTFWVMGIAAAPDVPSATLYAHLPTTNPRYARFTGGEIRAWLGGVRLPRNRIDAAEPVRAALLGDFDLRLETTLGRQVPGQMNFFMVSAQPSLTVMTVTLDGQDLIYTYRTRASKAGLEPAAVRLRGILAGLGPADTLSVEVSRVDAEACVTVAADRRCRIGYSAADAWAVFVPRFITDILPPRMLRWAWLALLFAPLGVWRRAGAVGWGTALVALGTLAASASLPALLPFSWDLALVPLMAYAAGRGLGGMLPPSPAAATMVPEPRST